MNTKSNEEIVGEFEDEFGLQLEDNRTGENERGKSWLQTILTAKDTEKEGAVQEERERCLAVFEDLTTWHNANNQIPDSELGKSEKHWDMLRKIVKDSLTEVSERAGKYLTTPLQESDKAS